MDEQVSGVSLKQVFTQPDWFVATGFGAGLAPFAPGTFGSLVGILLWLGLLHFPAYLYISTVTGIFFLGIHFSDRVAKKLGEKDPSCIVIDEIAGMLVALFLVPQVWYWVLVAFLLFRLLDIIKPWPVSYFDRNVKGGAGVMLDDLTAGMIAFVLLQGGIWMLNRLS